MYPSSFPTVDLATNLSQFRKPWCTNFGQPMIHPNEVSINLEGMIRFHHSWCWHVSSIDMYWFLISPLLFAISPNTFLQPNTSKHSSEQIPINGGFNEKLISGWWFGTWLLFFIYWEVHNPNWLSYFFQRGRYTTNQIYTSGIFLQTMLEWRVIQYFGELHHTTASPQSPLSFAQILVTPSICCLNPNSDGWCTYILIFYVYMNIYICHMCVCLYYVYICHWNFHLMVHSHLQ